MVTYVFFLRAYLQSALSGTRVLQAKLEFFFIADSRDLKDRSRTCLFVFACAFPCLHVKDDEPFFVLLRLLIELLVDGPYQDHAAPTHHRSLRTRSSL
jgi:hypothetical protein